MTNVEYLQKRIEDLQKNIKDKSLPIKFRKNQAVALAEYVSELEKYLNEIGDSL
ncbi:MAG: hypothetical protein KBT46_00115 [Ruminococcus sp.]|nr:hypothetical protein [Candidatus Copronaster equi]